MGKVKTLIAVAGVIALLAAACGEEEATSPGGGGGPTVIDSIGPTEGALSLIAWPGYTEKSWVKPFEQETGCEVTVKYGNTSDEMVNLMRQQGGSLHDGVPYMWGPNFLMYNTDEVTQTPSSWDVVFEPGSLYAGKVTAYDSPIYIADAAMYLMTHQPDLGISDPYELTQEQLDAAVELLKGQAGMISKYWAVYTDEIDGFESGDMVIGTAWPVNQQYVEKVPVESVIPSEGVTGWADTWMMSSNAQHPNCMLKWMEYTLRSDVQEDVAEFYGATPSNTESCPKLAKALGDAAAIYHCGDEEILASVFLWKTPLSDCGDDRGNVCLDYATWTNAWTEIRGAG